MVAAAVMHILCGKVCSRFGLSSTIDCTNPQPWWNAWCLQTCSMMSPRHKFCLFVKKSPSFHGFHTIPFRDSLERSSHPQVPRLFQPSLKVTWQQDQGDEAWTGSCQPLSLMLLAGLHVSWLPSKDSNCIHMAVVGHGRSVGASFDCW
jgi:hypothetical protein